MRCITQSMFSWMPLAIYTCCTQHILFASWVLSPAASSVLSNCEGNTPLGVHCCLRVQLNRSGYNIATGHLQTTRVTPANNTHARFNPCAQRRDCTMNKRHAENHGRAIWRGAVQRLLILLVFAFAGLAGLAWAQAGGASQPQCPTGFSFTDGLCRGAPSVCPAGTSLQAGVCTGLPGCPVGAGVEGGLCTQAPVCASGFSYNNRTATCTSSPVCGKEGRFNAELGRCVQDAQCIPSIAGRRCSCPTGGEYREAGNVCVLGVPVCPSGARFDTASKACL